MKEPVNEIQNTAQPGSSLQCFHCHQPIPQSASGTHHRNHCPRCLWSVHLDNHPGDRAAKCGEKMEPIAVQVRPNGEWLLIHRCQRCHTLNANRIAGVLTALLHSSTLAVQGSFRAYSSFCPFA